MEEIMIGKVEIGDKSYIFKFCNNTLDVYFDSDAVQGLFMGKKLMEYFFLGEKKELPFEKLDGILIDGSSRVTFYFGKNNYG